MNCSSRRRFSLRRHAGLAAREPLLQFRQSGLESLVFFPRQARHLLDGLEFLALDQIEIPQPLLGLSLEQGIDLAPEPLGYAGGVVHQSRDLVEKAIGGLSHGYFTFGAPTAAGSDAKMVFCADACNKAG